MGGCCAKACSTPRTPAPASGPTPLIDRSRMRRSWSGTGSSRTSIIGVHPVGRSLHTSAAAMPPAHATGLRSSTCSRCRSRRCGWDPNHRSRPSPHEDRHGQPRLQHPSLGPTSGLRHRLTSQPWDPYVRHQVSADGPPGCGLDGIASQVGVPSCRLHLGMAQAFSDCGRALSAKARDAPATCCRRNLRPSSLRTATPSALSTLWPTRVHEPTRDRSYTTSRGTIGAPGRSSSAIRYGRVEVIETGLRAHAVAPRAFPGFHFLVVAN